MERGKVEEFKRRARGLENSVGLKLVAYSKFSADFGQRCLLGSAGDADGREDMARELEELMDALARANDGLAACLSDGDRTHSSSLSHIVNHHRERLQGYRNDFKSISQSISQAEAQAKLLSTVRYDISQHKAGNDRNNNNKDSKGGMEEAMNERNAVFGTEEELNRVLGSAIANRDALARQRGILGGTLSKLKAAAGMMPGLSNVMTKIKRRKRRDFIIIGVLVAIFIFMLFLYARR